MDNAKTLTVVIPCKNGALHLPGQLCALSAQEWRGPWEVVIADNGSSDETRGVAARFEGRLPALRVVDASDRPGPAHARNVGSRHASGDLLVFVDADDEVDRGFLQAMADALERHQFVAARYDYQSLNEGWVQGSRPPVQAVGLIDMMGFLPYAGSGGLGIWRSTFDRIGGFDPSHRLSGEDIDFCWRAQLAGVRLHFEPNAVVRVRLRSGLRDLYRQGFSYGRGEALLHHKFRSAGLPPVPMRRGLTHWRRLFRGLRRARDRTALALQVRNAGRRMGRLQGAIRYRVRCF